MNVLKTKLPGVFKIEPDVFTDERGFLIKTFHKNTFTKHGLISSFEEAYTSTSNKGVIRGMHFQIPPKDHAKLVHVSRGSVIDVILDIRKNSPTYGQFVTFELSEKNNLMLYIPRGCAHGFLSLEDNSCMNYLQETMRSPEHESGIDINSFGMNWNIPKPIVSKRDESFLPFENYNSPFIYEEQKYENID